MAGFRRSMRPEDPRRLRVLLDRGLELSQAHGLTTVVVGLAGQEGDLLLPELLDYIQSALRIEDSIHRITRERAVLFLADVSRTQVEAILDRLRVEFGERFPTTKGPDLSIACYEIRPGGDPPTLKEVLPAVFPLR